jgi:hypothetical protein
MFKVGSAVTVHFNGSCGFEYVTQGNIVSVDYEHEVMLVDTYLNGMVSVKFDEVDQF